MPDKPENKQKKQQQERRTNTQQSVVNKIVLLFLMAIVKFTVVFRVLFMFCFTVEIYWCKIRSWRVQCQLQADQNAKHCRCWSARLADWLARRAGVRNWAAWQFSCVTQSHYHHWNLFGFIFKCGVLCCVSVLFFNWFIARRWVNQATIFVVVLLSIGTWNAKRTEFHKRSLLILLPLVVR